MIHFREADEITTWVVAFHTPAKNRWVRWLVPGRFKHVSVFGYSAKARCWLFIDPDVTCVRTVLLPDGNDAERRLAQYTDGAAVLKMVALPSKPRFRPAVCCTTVVSHLLGIPGGALLPDTLWRKCLRNGATVVYELSCPAGPANAPA